MLTRFLESGYRDLSEPQLTGFKRLLDEQDPELIQWLVEQRPAEDKGLSEIVQLIQKANNL